MALQALLSSIPANNEKIIELYNKVKSNQLDTSPSFQRKLVWKKQHKVKFIETILLNFPFPEIYKAPGELNVDALALTDVVVDGQQRITTIVDFIDGKDVFSLANTQPKFSELEDAEKKRFLNYEVSVRYLKDASEEQVKEIFQRINDTEYRLNSTERLNAQWGDSEFVHFAKQLLDNEYTFDKEMFLFNIENRKRNFINEFFEKNDIFTKNDNSRMLSLQWMLALIATVEEGKYFRRYEKVQNYVELYNDEFNNAEDTLEQLINVLSLIEECSLSEKSYWFNKSNMFSLIIELFAYDTSSIDVIKLKEKLEFLQNEYTRLNKSDNSDSISIEQKYIDYFEHARDSVNDSSARNYRGGLIKEFIEECLVS